MSDASLWWIAAGIAVAIELGTGTFYLLMLALGLSAAGLAAHLGASTAVQITIAASVGAGSIALWHMWRQQHRAATPIGSNRDLNLDIGARVQVKHWSPEGSAQVSYRGANWAARYVGTAAPQPGTYVIRAIEGSQLQLDHAEPPALS